jgi:phosphate-selective porin OprO/OprP
LWATAVAGSAAVAATEPKAESVAITAPEAAYALPDDELPAVPSQVRFFFPDLAVGRRIVPDLDWQLVSARLGVEVIGDWTGFAQDAASKALHGVQSDRFEVRSARVQLGGRILTDDRLSYRVAAQYRGFDIDPQRNWDVTDLSLTWQFNSRGSRINIGQIRETFSYETLASTASMPQSERVIGLFAAARNPGIAIIHVFGKDSDWTASFGLYRDSFGVSGAGAGTTARVTHLLWERGPDHYLHVGAGIRVRPDDDGVIRYRGRPGSNVADNFVDTGDFPSGGATHFGLEGLWADGPLAVSGEYVLARVSSPERRDPTFQGFYVVGSWVLSGEQRPYDRTSGLARRLIPTARWGAPELMARYSAVDLNSGDVLGGSFDRFEVGANWWATTRWKWGLLAGRTWSRQGGSSGRTDSLLIRGQWVY